MNAALAETVATLHKVSSGNNNHNERQDEGNKTVLNHDNTVVGLHAEPVLLLQLLQLVLELAATLLALAVPGTLRALEFETK